VSELDERRGGERRRTPRGGRRTTDPLPAAVRAEIDDYLRELEAALASIRIALDLNTIAQARESADALRNASDAIHTVLASRRSLKPHRTN
jgi:hypothetical protein